MADAVPTWEESTPVADNSVPTWEESTPVDTRQFSLTQADRKRIAEGFRDDPLGFIADEDQRRGARRITDTMQDPEDQRQRMALAAWFTRFNPGAEYNFVFANLDGILEKHYGKKVAVAQAWKDFHDMYHPAEATTLGELPGVAAHMFTAMGAGLAKTTLNVLNVALKMAAAPSMEERAARQLGLAPQEREAVENADREFAAGVDNLAKPWRRALTEVQEEHTRAVLPDENWFTNFNSEWGNNALMFLAIQAPQQAAQLALAYHMGPAAFCLAIGGSSAIDKYYDLEDTPGMTDRQKFLNAAFTGFINSGSAWITAGVVKGKIPALNKETIASGARGAVGYFLKAFGVEAGQEAVEQLAENITDIYTGVHGDPAKMDPGTYRKHLFNGVGESALAGGVFGLTAAGLGFKSWHDRMVLAENTRRKAETTVATLEKKGDLTPEEKRKLQRAKFVASQNEPGKVLFADALSNFVEENDSDEAIRKSQRFTELREAADPEVPDETVIEAVRSERARALSRELPHNPQDTADAALDLMVKFPQFKLEVYDTIDSVPEAVKKAMEEQTETPSLVRAWTDDAGVVHLIADRVRPDQAAKVVGHEIIGHHGLRAVLGDNFDSFLDDVYKLHASEIEAYADRYQADPESEEGRRYLTEEFLADCADANVKPSWWKEFLARCREFLDRVVGRHHFSDRDIEAALSRSARAVRKKRGLAFDRENAGVRFAVIGERGAANTNEAEKRLADLGIARQMLAAGRPRRDIKLATGWEKGKDGLWRMEVPDLKLRDGIEYLFLSRSPKALKDIITAPELFKAYPEIAQTPVVSAIFKNEAGEARDSVAAAYDPEEDRFYISANHLTNFSAGDSMDLRKTLIHEVQHKIQHMEGFAPGGNFDQFTQVDRLKSQVAEFRKKADASEKYRRYEEFNRDFDRFFENGTDEEIDAWEAKHRKEYDALHNDPEVQAIQNEKLAIVKQHGNSLNVLRILENPDDTRLWSTLSSNDEHNAMSSYRRLAGEVEARNASARADMSPEEKRASLLDDTADVAPEDRIYLSASEGTSFFADGKYFRNWQDVLAQFKKDLEGVELTPEQQEIYNAVTTPKATARIRINDLNELEDVFLHHGSRHKGAYKIISVHYAGLRNPVTALEVVSMGDIIRRGTLTENGNAQYPNSRRYELKCADGSTLKLVIDIDRKKQKTVINLYSDRKPEIGGNNTGLKSDAITVTDNIPQSGENSSPGTGIIEEKTGNGAGNTKNTGNTIDGTSESDLSDLSDQSDGNRPDRPDRTDRTDRTDRQGEIEENTGKDGAGKVRFSMGERPYYQIPFAEGLARVVDPAQKNDRSPVFVSETPEVFQRIGFTALPMMANARHLRLNYYTAEEFSRIYGRVRNDEHAHGLHDAIKHLPKALEHPLAILVNLAENATPGSVVAITDMNVNGKKIVVPVLIEAQSNADGEYIDSHLVLTVYDEKNWMEKFLKPALEAEKKGIGIFYFDEEKAARYNARSKGTEIIPTGFIHNIDDEDSPVKGIFKKITETLQFKRWFGDSKVVDEKGEPLVVYHDTNAKIFINRETGENWDELDWKAREEWENRDDWDEHWKEQDFYTFSRVRARRSIEYPGFFFTPTPDPYHEYGSRRIAAYLSIQNPAVNPTIENAGVYDDSGEAAMKKLIEQGYDGVIRTDENGKVEEYIAFFPEQIKSATDNIGTYDPKNPDIRFSLGELDENTRRLVSMMQVAVGEGLTETGEVYAEKFKKIYGVDLDPKEAKIIASMAVEENRKEYFRRYRKEALQFYRDSDPAFDFFLNFAGPNGKLNPGRDHLGEAFTGKWISDDYKKYSIERHDHKTARGRTAYQIRRENALENAGGTPLNEVAKAYAEYAGIDPDEAAERLLESLRHLNIKEIKSAYAKHRQDSFAFDRETARKTQEEFMRQEKFRIENEVTEILSRGEGVTADFLRENRDVYKELYRVLFDGKDAPYNIGKADLEAINAALTQQAGNAATYAQAYKDARKKAWEAYSGLLRMIRETLRQDKIDAVKLQTLAKEFAFTNIDRGFREKFLSRIVGLARYGNRPNKDYPNGRRMAEFDKLCKDMLDFEKNLRRDNAIRKIRELLDRNRTRRTDKNVLYSPMGERQPALDRIAQIVKMSPENAANCLDWALQEKARLDEEIETLDNTDAEIDPAKFDRRHTLNLELYYLKTFGALSQKSPDDAVRALESLKKFIREGHSAFELEKGSDLAHFQELRDRVRHEMSNNAAEIPGEMELDRRVNLVDDYFYGHVSIIRMLDELSRTDNLYDLHFNTAAGEFIRKIEDATTAEQTRLNAMQHWFDDTLKFLGIDSLVKKGKFLNAAMTETDTGVKITEYGSWRQEGDVKIPVWGNRGRKQAYMRLEHCRKMLEEMTSLKIAAFIPVDKLDLADPYTTVRGQLTEAGVSPGRTFSVCADKEGNFVVFTENDAAETVAYTVPKEKLPCLDNWEKAAIPLHELTRFGAESQIHDYDRGGLNRKSGIFGDTVDDAQLDAFRKKEETPEVMLFAPEPDAPQRQTELHISPGGAMELLLEWDQPGYRPVMEWNGYSQEVMDSLRAWLDKANPAYWKFAEAMREFLKRNRAELDRAVFKRYGVHLPEQENFFYADFSGSVAQQVQDPGFGNPAGGMTVSANFLTGRKFHLNAPSVHTNAISLFMRKNLEQTHFIVWTQVVRELRAVYGNRDVQRTMVKYFGQAAWGNFKQRIEMLAANGSEPLDKLIVQIVNNFYRNWTPSNIALNPSSFLKQIGGAFSYLDYVPLEALKYLPEANLLNHDYRMFLEAVKHGDYLRNRQEGGLAPNLAGLMNYTRRGGKASPVSDEITRRLTSPTVKADTISATVAGYAVYRYYYELAKKRGLPETSRPDPELRAAAEKLAGDPIVKVGSGVIKAGNGRTAIQNAMAWVREHIADTYDTAAGKVVVDERSAKTSLSHTIYQNKLDAFQAIPQVLTDGVYLGHSPDKDGKAIENHYFAAPVMIGDQKKIVFVRTRSPLNHDNRFYVHEVFTEDEIRSAASTLNSPMQTGDSVKATDLYRNILSQVLNVKSETCHDFAIRMWQRATDETQQSGALKDANRFTAAPGLGRFLTVYRLNPMQTAALEISAFRKFFKDRNRKNFDTLLRRVIVNHLIAATTMNLIASFFRHGINVGDYLDDWRDYLAGWLLGSFDSLYLLIRGGMGIFRGLTGEKSYGNDLSAVPLLDDLGRDAGIMRKLLTGKDTDPADAVKAFGDFLMSAGSVQSRTAGMVMHAGARLVKTILRVVDPDRRKTRRRR